MEYDVIKKNSIYLYELIVKYMHNLINKISYKI